MRDILQGPQNTDLWYFDHAHLGNNNFTTTNPDDPNPLIWTYGTDRIVIGHVADKALDNSSAPATWLFERQDDGTWTIRTYDQRFLGLDLGDTGFPMLYPVNPGGQGGFANWELVSVPTVEGDVVGWTTVSRTVDAVTRFLVGGQQGTRVVTVMVTSTVVCTFFFVYCLFKKGCVNLHIHFSQQTPTPQQRQKNGQEAGPSPQ